MTVEVAVFKLAHGTSIDEFQGAAREVTGHLRRFDGFKRRELLHDPDSDVWIDIVHWTSRDLAQQAADTIMERPEFEAFLQKIDPSSVQMHHGEPVEAAK